MLSQLMVWQLVAQGVCRCGVQRKVSRLSVGRCLSTLLLTPSTPPLLLCVHSVCHTSLLKQPTSSLPGASTASEGAIARRNRHAMHTCEGPPCAIFALGLGLHRWEVLLLPRAKWLIEAPVQAQVFAETQQEGCIHRRSISIFHGAAQLLLASMPHACTHGRNPQSITHSVGSPLTTSLRT